MERQITNQPLGHILTNIGAWTADGDWLVYDVRTDVAGSVFDGARIERVNVKTGEIEVLYHGEDGAYCGVVTCSPISDEVVFIQGPEHPTADWSYSPEHRQGVIVSCNRPFIATNLDARNITVPFTPGALRGGSHVHVFSGDGKFVSFTYEDHVLARLAEQSPETFDGNFDLNQRNVGVAMRGKPVRVPKSSPRNRDGSFFSVLLTKTVNQPKPGSDELSKAYDDAWVGTNGYLRADGTRQQRAIAFLGDVLSSQKRILAELYIVDFPEDISIAGDLPLEGSSTRRPAPPAGTTQRRLTRTESRKHPGLCGPRQWPRSSPDGSQIAFLMRDEQGIVQLFTISPNGGIERQITHLPFDVASAFSWHPDGNHVTFVADGSIFVTTVHSGESQRLTAASHESGPRPEACLFSPDGTAIAYVRTIEQNSARHNQIFVVDYESISAANDSGR